MNTDTLGALNAVVLALINTHPDPAKLRLELDRIRDALLRPSQGEATSQGLLKEFEGYRAAVSAACAAAATR